MRDATKQTEKSIHVNVEHAGPATLQAFLLSCSSIFVHKESLEAKHPYRRYNKMNSIYVRKSREKSHTQMERNVIAKKPSYPLKNTRASILDIRA